MNRMLATLVFALSSAFAVGAAAQSPTEYDATRSAPASAGKPTEARMRLAGSTTIDLRTLSGGTPVRGNAARPADPESHPRELASGATAGPASAVPVVGSAARAPTITFEGLDFATFGSTYPPDANGDVGPVYYIQAINSSVGIFRKSDGFRVAAFTLNTLMSQGSFGNLCDTNNQGDAVVLYDTFEDRWVITDVAYARDGSNNVINPPGAFQCFAVSKTGDPLKGGWNFYSIAVAGGLNDAPKLGIWTDGIYLSTNLLNYLSPNAFIAPRVYALNKAQMYAGLPSVQIVSFDAPTADFSLLPSNARLQTGTPPAGTPNYFVSSWQYLNALTVYKFHVDWNRIGLSTFTGPDVPLAATSWPNATVPAAPSLGGNNLDVVQIRAMAQAQYTNLGGAESVWATHTVRRANTTGFAASRWYQVNVTGGSVTANLPQAATWDPDAANVMHRFIPSLAINRAGDMALGYTTSSSTTKPALKYAGRLASDPINTFSQTEQTLVQGDGTQVGTCAGVTCTRWGEYSAMSLDPDGCTFWMTGEYYAADGLNYQTRIGSFSYPSCTTVGAGGTVSGTVTAAVGGAPLSGATVSLGSRTTTTDASGVYSFTSIPAGTYPGLSASFPGCTNGAASNIVVIDSNTTTQNFALASAPESACLTDTAQTDFQAGLLTNVDLSTTPGDVTLAGGPVVDQQNGTLGTSGVGITVATWGGQTFTPSVTGLITRVDVNLFCSGCTGTTPNLTLSIRATSGGLPTGADLATATITGFNSGASAYHTATLAVPITLNAGTQYAFVVRPTANPAPGTYALTRSGTSTAGADVYAGGTRVAGATSGTVWSVPLTGGVNTDSGFRVYMDTGFRASGDLTSSVKDANPAPGHMPTWSTLSWNATVPANTSLQFQVAASNSITGPFNFVGPDGTAGTYFTTSGASLSQFDNNRYLRYRAYFATTDSAVSPTLNDVTVCFTNPCIAPPTPTITPGGPTTFCAGGSVTLTSSSASGNQWSLSGNPIGGATSQSFIATASGNYTTTVTNEFQCASASSSTTTVTVNPSPSTPTITPGGPTTFYAGGSVTLTSSSASGNQWYLDGNPIGGATGQQYVAAASGNY
ncbi:MAG TPA: carboxypeptidase-like regulatory domain-containing protein, partial [Tahibacter sp.]|uniref:carboxypeptidase-like regulatory domain-containing protein n=1 Tax=Tahibacter sp. TaxID=2056211 RepID=UPI002CB29379